MSAKPENPPAFPSPQNENFRAAEYGMSLRDYFAAKAMQGALSNEENFKRFNEIRKQKKPDYFFENYVSEIAFCCADAMLKAREL